MMRLENAGILKNGKFNLTEPEIIFLVGDENYCNLLEIEKETGISMSWKNKIFMWFDNFDPAVCN